MAVRWFASNHHCVRQAAVLRIEGKVDQYQHSSTQAGAAQIYITKQVALMPDDRDLGMDSKITRRDFVEGVSVAVASSMLPSDIQATASDHKAIGDLNG